MSDDYQHPAFPQPANLEACLWRYLDYDKFDWLMNYRRLFMPAAHFLGDPLEGTRPDGDLEWWRTQAEQATSEVQRQSIKKNQELLSSFARAFRPNYYVSCWHMNEVESEAMWKCYTKNSESVAVKTSYRELRALLPAYVEIGMVRYIDYATEQLPSLNMFEFITHKNISYGFEREVRAVVFPPPTKGLGSVHFKNNLFESETKKGFLAFAPEIDISRMIHGVVLHPKSTLEFTATVIANCERASLPMPVVSAFSGQGGLHGSL